MIFSIVGLILLVASPVLCWFQHEKTALWMGALIVGEIAAWTGVFLTLSKFT